MDKITIFFYLKTYQFIQAKNYKFEHTLFHLHRYLRREKNFRWERLFVFEENKLVDDGKAKTLRTLFHHDFIHFKTHELTQEGLKWLRENEEAMTELNQYVEEFFSNYKGEYAFENSCFARGNTHTISCHLCEEATCKKEESWIELFSELNFFKLKTPFKSFSQKATSI